MLSWEGGRRGGVSTRKEFQVSLPNRSSLNFLYHENSKLKIDLFLLWRTSLFSKEVILGCVVFELLIRLGDFENLNFENLNFEAMRSRSRIRNSTTCFLAEETVSCC